MGNNNLNIGELKMKVVRFNNVPAGYYRNYYCEQGHQDIKSHLEDSDDGVKISLAIPVYSKENINLNIEDQILTISSKEGNEKESFFTPKDFSKQYKLSDKIDIDAIKANFENGILNI